MVCTIMQLAWLAASVTAVAASPKFKGTHGAIALSQNVTEAEHKNPNTMEFNAVSNVFNMFAIHSPQGGVAAAAKDGAPTAGAGDAKKQPVGIQVEEKVMDDMQKSLSKECGKRYSAMIAGKGPEMHSFDQHGESDKPEQCEENLKGHVCETVALITENKDVPDGRQMVAKIKVEGKSCLPKECSNQEDLQVLSAFMHKQSKEVLPGEDVKVNLHVDCSKAGGGVVEADGQSAAHPEPQSLKQKSGASVLLGFVPAAILLLCAMA